MEALTDTPTEDSGLSCHRPYCVGLLVPLLTWLCQGRQGAPGILEPSQLLHESTVPSTWLAWQQRSVNTG